MTDFAIKNVKYSDFASEETHCFQATLYVDGKRLCTVSNDGHGGCDDYRPLNDKMSYRELMDRIHEIDEELGKETITETGGGNYAFSVSNSLEIVVGNLMNQWLQDKEIKKILKKVAFVKPDTPKGSYHTLQGSVKPTEKNIESVKRAPWWQDDFIILNTLPIDEVRSYL